jgi:hypothetical protein
MLKPLLRNHPNPDSINWRFCDKETYLEIENLLTDGVTLYDPFQIDSYLSEEDFAELKSICVSHTLKSMDYNQHLQKWEEQIELPQHLLDKILNRVRNAVGTEDIHIGYYYYTHHQITEDGRVPRLPLHIDYSQGAYMVGLVINKNRDWEVVAQDKVFNLQENQAYISQPQFDYHWRPSWGNQNKDEYHAILLFHLINRNNWSIANDDPFQNREQKINDRFPDLGPKFISNEDYDKYRMQQRAIFDSIYIDLHSQSDLPPIPWDERPTAEDAAKEKRVKNIGAN